MSPGPIGGTDLPKYPPALKFMTQKLQIKKIRCRGKSFPCSLRLWVNFSLVSISGFPDVV